VCNPILFLLFPHNNIAFTSNFREFGLDEVCRRSLREKRDWNVNVDALSSEEDQMISAYICCSTCGLILILGNDFQRTFKQLATLSEHSNCL
jgi:hypothetical protein